MSTKIDIEEIIKKKDRLKERQDPLYFINLIVRFSTIYLISYLTLPYPAIILLIFFTAELNRTGYILLFLYIFKFLAVDSIIPADDVYLLLAFSIAYNELCRQNYRYTLFLTPLFIFMILEGWLHKLTKLIF